MFEISIIVLTYNCQEKITSHLTELIKRTVPYPNIEIIVKDGASVDGTIDQILKFTEQVTFVSKYDGGIYSGLNQAIERASKEFIAICHVGDMLNIDSLMELANSTNNFGGYDIVCGATEVHYANSTKFFKANKNLKALDHTMSLIHPSAIIRKKTLTELNGYNENFKISGDYDFFVRAKGLEKRFMICDVKISEIEYGGVSTQLSSIMTLVKEYSLILQKKGIIKLFFIAKFILLNTISISKGVLKN